VRKRRLRLEANGNEAWVDLAQGERSRRFVAYYRVSTRQQGRSGLGLDAQRSAVANFLAATRGELFAEFTEVESGTRKDRPQFVEGFGFAGFTVQLSSSRSWIG
jgi:hypothetical protein